MGTESPAAAAAVAGDQGSNGSNDSDGGPSAANAPNGADGGDGAGSEAPGPCARTSAADIKIAAAPSIDSFAFVWDGDHYVFAYSDATQGDGDIYAVLVNSDGTLRGAPIAVAPSPAASVLPSIIVTAAGYLVVWEEGTAGQAVYAHAIDKNGQPTGQGVAIASTSALEARPVLSAAPGGVAVAWMDTVLGIPAVDVALLDANLKVTGPQRIDGQAAAASFPWVAGDANQLAVAWSEQSADHYDIRFADLSTTQLAMKDDASLRGVATGNAVLPRMIRTGFGYLAAWEDMRGDANQIFMSLVDPTGMTIGNGLVEEPGSGDANWPNMAWTGTATAVVFYQFRAGSPQIFLTVEDPTGNRVGAHDLQVSQAPAGAWARFPDVQFNGTDLGVAWVDTREGAPQLYFARVTCSP